MHVASRKENEIARQHRFLHRARASSSASSSLGVRSRHGRSPYYCRLHRGGEAGGAARLVGIGFHGGNRASSGAAEADKRRSPANAGVIWQRRRARCLRKFAAPSIIKPAARGKIASAGEALFDVLLPLCAACVDLNVTAMASPGKICRRVARSVIVKGGNQRK